LSSRSPVAVIDTNVVVSGLLASNSNAATSRVLDGMLERRFNFLLSSGLLAEYGAVLLRPRIQELHGLDGEEVDRLLTEIAANAVVREGGDASAEPSDRGDRQLWNLLEAHQDSFLVTGDRKLLEGALYSERILGPRAFVDSLED
jgi:putative PIN family toxin of toxin-antitoxin system